MKFYNLSRKERRKLKSQFDKTVLGVNIKDTCCIFIVLATFFLVSPLLLCILKGFEAISLSVMIFFVGFFLVFSGLFYIMVMIRYVFLKEFYDDREKEKSKDKENK